MTLTGAYKHRTTFKKIPVRGHFEFYPTVAGGPWVKNGTNTYAKATTVSTAYGKIIKGLVPKYTGRVQYWVGATFTVSYLNRPVIERYPSRVYGDRIGEGGGGAGSPGASTD